MSKEETARRTKEILREMDAVLLVYSVEKSGVERKDLEERFEKLNKEASDKIDLLESYDDPTSKEMRKNLELSNKLADLYRIRDRHNKAGRRRRTARKTLKKRKTRKH